MTDYMLRCCLKGHESDVRCLAVIDNDGIVTGSRDKTCKLWIPEENNYKQSNQLTGSSSFISSLCYIHSDEIFPKGFLLVGSNDSSIYGYLPDAKEYSFKLLEHKDTVSALAYARAGIFISGSWDATVKIWLNQKCIKNVIGHTAAIWSLLVISDEGLLLTASADKTIKLWKGEECQRTFEGHTDCVRGLSLIDRQHFLSCSNDASIKLWSLQGECLKTYFGHTNYIYSIASFENGNRFASCGEDGSLRIWNKDRCQQVILIPAQSLWSLNILSNDDIAVGCSDSFCWVFTSDVTRFAPDCDKEYFHKTGSQFHENRSSELGNMKVSDLPGLEYLNNVGKHDGQKVMIRENNQPILYTWNSAENNWIRVGEVIGATDPNKQLFEGKEYDYIFRIDVEEGKPPLKFPFNLNDDPWVEAQAFIHRHNLSQLFLDQIAKFIISNTKQSVQNKQNHEDMYCDPFTVKLQELNPHISDENIVKLKSLCELNTPISEDDFKLLETLLIGKSENLFPALDILRLSLRRQDVSLHFCQSSRALLQDVLFNNLKESSLSKNRLLSLRCLCNMFLNSCGEEILMSMQETLINLTECMKTSILSRQEEIAIATLILNFTLLGRKNPSFQIQSVLFTLIDFLLHIKDDEALYRSLIALGIVLTYKNALKLKIPFVEVTNFLKILKGMHHSDKVIDVVSKIDKILSTKK